MNDPIRAPKVLDLVLVRLQNGEDRSAIVGRVHKEDPDVVDLTWFPLALTDEFVLGEPGAVYPRFATAVPRGSPSDPPPGTWRYA